MLELQGVARRAGAGVCTLTLVGLCLGVTAPASFADERGHHADKHADDHASRHAEKHSAKHSDRHRDADHRAAHHTKKAVPARAKPAKAERHDVARPIPPVRPVHPVHAGYPLNRVKHAHIKLHDILLPGALAGTDTTDPLVRRPSALVVPAATAPETPAPVVSVVVRQVPKPRAGRASAPTVSAEALLDVTTVSPVAARHVVAPRRLVSTSARRSVSQVATSRAVRAASSVARATVPAQLVNRDAPRIGAWPTGPVSLPTRPAGLPMSVALGGLVLALAAARGVARMRHPRTDDPDLSFPTA